MGHDRMSVILNGRDKCYWNWLLKTRDEWAYQNNHSWPPELPWEKFCHKSAKEHHANIVEYLDQRVGMITTYLEFEQEIYYTAFVLKYS